MFFYLFIYLFFCQKHSCTFLAEVYLNGRKTIVLGLISKKHELNNCFIKSNQVELDLADFMFHERQEDDLMTAISRAWNNGLYLMWAFSQ